MQSLSFNRSRADEWDGFLEITPEQWQNLLTSIAAEKPTLNLEDLSRDFGTVLQARAAGNLAKNVVAFRRLIDKGDVVAGELLEAVKSGMIKFGWDQNKINQVEANWNSLFALITDERVETVTKFSELYFIHRLHVHDVKIVTTMIPVFNSGRENVVAVATKNMLHITYSDGAEEEQTLELAIGLDEVDKLKREAENAIAKSDKIGKLVEDRIGVPNRFYTAS